MRSVHLKMISALALAAALTCGPPALSEEIEDKAIGLNLDLGFATAYVFRGLNVFAEDEQMDPNMLLAPGISWSVFDTGLSVGYWGAFQITGDNIGAKIDGALGAEQDLFVAYELGLPFDLTLSAALTYYLYPGSTREAVGSTMASYIEPKVGLTWGGFVDVGLDISYFLGIQDKPGIRGISYLYLNPKIGKELKFTDMFGLALSLGYGFKLFEEGNHGMPNVHDVTLSVGVPIQILDFLYVKPGLNLAWTNIPTLDVGDEIVFWGGLNLGVDL